MQCNVTNEYLLFKKLYRPSLLPRPNTSLIRHVGISPTRPSRSKRSLCFLVWSRCVGHSYTYIKYVEYIVDYNQSLLSLNRYFLMQQDAAISSISFIYLMSESEDASAGLCRAHQYGISLPVNITALASCQSGLRWNGKQAISWEGAWLWMVGKNLFISHFSNRLRNIYVVVWCYLPRIIYQWWLHNLHLRKWWHYWVNEIQYYGDNAPAGVRQHGT